MNKIKELVLITLLFSILVYSSYYIGTSTKAFSITGSSIKCNIIVNNTTTLELSNIFTTSGLASTQPLKFEINSTSPILVTVQSPDPNITFGLTYNKMDNKLLIPVPAGDHQVLVYVGVLSESNTSIKVSITGSKNNRVYCNKTITVNLKP